MKFKFTKIAILVVVLIGLFQLWAQSDRITSTEPTSLKLENIEVVGQDSAKGNLLGIQPYLLPADYANETIFYNKLSGYLTEAKNNGFITDKTIVVFPEYTGTWLVAVNEKASVYSAPTVNSAITTVVLTHPLSFIKNYFGAPADDKAKYAVFLMKAEEMATIYERVFSKLAKEFGVTVVGGSIVLPEPSVSAAGRLKIKKGNLYNVCGVFGPDGKLKDPLSIKAFPINDEKIFTCAGKAQNIPVYQTSAGNLGVVICADSWYPAVYETLKNKKASLLAVPSFSAPDNLWSTKWKGYNGAAIPADVNKTDIGKLTEKDAWLKYSMGGRALKSTVSNGINVFLRGKLWDLGDDGSVIYLKNKTVNHSKIIDGAALINIWL
ncbi:nitrilase-related carbon-nitrogen hydrolase [Solitalea canadensis]|uniref:Putative amidohydrolase n=1 Tax=Solitalea canadensis (strain ATCC 29591 / DSM 3403 / JCM 21819 / LMG 8368 / NBRC 15130 / NCIMB 12057 / USAM 9D) TaxID=929556 RepID=H8KY27_SOLCM|nr:nitrilase-related carbon-nitrogen hydrolase [Solitalea canadensis]AFD05765.1 putative amidohydrolase [Solitalea canadensis DSM 3403]